MNNIVEKIKKLLRLSEDPTNEHVAQAAAQKAQELIAEHNIQGEMLVDKEEGTKREDPDWQGFVFVNKRIQPWSVNLCVALARNNYGRVGIYTGRGVKFCGSKVDFDVVKTMYTWIAKQLHDLATHNCYGRVEATNYKLGAVSTIGKRLDQAKKDAEAKMEVEALMDEVDGKSGLVLYRDAIIALDDYKKKADDRASKDLSGTWRGGQGGVDRSAYSRGVVDGKSVSLTGHQIGG